MALVLYLMIGGAITFGIWLHAAGQIQQAANLGARELSQTPLPYDITLEDALDEPIVRQRVYDNRWLVIDLTALQVAQPDYNFFTDIVPQMPLLNQQLAVLYIREDVPDETAPSGVRRLLRYPGALLQRSEPIVDPPIDLPFVAQQYVVQIPIVVDRQPGHNNGGGAERIRWACVVEEIDSEDLDADDSGPNPDPFSISGAADVEGVVALRVHYPAQSAWMSSYQDRGTYVPNGGDPNAAIDGGVVSLNPNAMKGELLDDRPLVFEDETGERVYAGTYGGRYGLGIHGAMTSAELTGSSAGIRPYRRVLVSHAIFRREAFTESVQD